MLSARWSQPAQDTETTHEWALSLLQARQADTKLNCFEFDKETVVAAMTWQQIMVFLHEHMAGDTVKEMEVAFQCAEDLAKRLADQGAMLAVGCIAAWKELLLLWEPFKQSTAHASSSTAIGELVAILRRLTRLQQAIGQLGAESETKKKVEPFQKVVEKEVEARKAKCTTNDKVAVEEATSFLRDWAKGVENGKAWLEDFVPKDLQEKTTQKTTCHILVTLEGTHSF